MMTLFYVSLLLNLGLFISLLAMALLVDKRDARLRQLLPELEYYREKERRLEAERAAGVRPALFGYTGALFDAPNTGMWGSVASGVLGAPATGVPGVDVPNTGMWGGITAPLGVPSGVQGITGSGGIYGMSSVSTRPLLPPVVIDLSGDEPDSPLSSSVKG